MVSRSNLEETFESLGFGFRSAANLDGFDHYKNHGGELDDYGNHWLYGYRFSRFEDGGPGYVIATDEHEYLLGLHGDGFHLCPLFEGPISVVSCRNLYDLSERLSARSNRRVVIRRCPSSTADSLFRSGLFVHRHRGDLEEDNFPETMLDIAESLSIARDPKSTWSKKIRRFERAEHNLTTHRDSSATEWAMSALRDLAASRSRFLAYERMLDAAIRLRSDSVQNTQLWVFSNSSTSRPEGLYLSARLGDASSGLYIALSSMSVPGLTEYLDMRVVDDLSNVVDNLFLGGSESAGVVRYISKLGPISVPSRYLVLEPR